MMTDHHDRSSAASPISGLRIAVPYLRLYQGSTFVLKAGGEVFENQDHARSLMEQIGILHQLGIRVVLVHGGGPQTDRACADLGIEPQRVQGRRVTDERTRDISTMVLNGSVNTRILALCRALGVTAVGLSGVDAGLVNVQRRPPQSLDGETVDFGLVGDVVDVRPDVLERLTSDGYIPVVSPLSADSQGEVLNLNADGVASALAVALGARKLILLTGARGILEDPRQPDHFLSIVDLDDLQSLTRGGSIQAGMLPKAKAIQDALNGGVERVHVISHRVTDSLLTEVFTNEGSGTLVVRSRRDLPSQPAAAHGHVGG